MPNEPDTPENTKYLMTGSLPLTGTSLTFNKGLSSDLEMGESTLAAILEKTKTQGGIFKTKESNPILSDIEYIFHREDKLGLVRTEARVSYSVTAVIDSASMSCALSPTESVRHLKEKLVRSLLTKIYDNRNKEIREAMHDWLMQMRPYGGFVDARIVDRVLKACGYVPRVQVRIPQSLSELMGYGSSFEKPKLICQLKHGDLVQFEAGKTFVVNEPTNGNGPYFSQL